MEDELIVVRLLELPVALHYRTTQHIDDLQREFSYITAEPGSVPQRLLALAQQLGADFGRFGEGPNATLRAAATAGAEAVDILYPLPAPAAVAARTADQMLDEADEFCRSGELLTVAAEEDTLSYRRWFFGEVADQIEGKPPCPWPQWRDRA